MILRVMKKIFFFGIILLLNNCSFDKSSRIWNDENQTSKSKKIFSDFKTLSSKNEKFNKTVYINPNTKLNLPKITSNSEWTDVFYNKTNNVENLKYDGGNQLDFKSKKITKYKVNEQTLFEKESLILTDLKGNLIIYSLKENRTIKKFNFYKNRFKKINKKLNIIVENKVIYVSDNIGFIYAIDYQKDKLLWAKDYKIPFRSNLKISNNKLLAANQNNNLYFFNKFNGEILRLIPTEETVTKNQFVNSLSSSNELSFFLNTYGSLYALDNTNMRINWFLNLNQSLDLNPSNLFNGKQIINYRNFVVVPSDNHLYVLNKANGSIIFRKNVSSLIRPIIAGNKIFLVTRNSLLIAINIKDGKVIYSYNIKDKINNFSKKKFKENINSMILANNDLYIFTDKSKVLRFSINGEIENIYKLPSKVKTTPIIVKNSLLYLDTSNRLSIIN